MSAAVVARWSAFLGKIEQRYAQIEAETEAGCRAILEACELDPVPMTNAFTAMRTRIIGLEQKIEQTWSGKVEPLLGEAGVAEAQQARGEALVRRMERDRERLEVRVFADAAEEAEVLRRTNVQGVHYAQPNEDVFTEQQAMDQGLAAKNARAARTAELAGDLQRSSHRGGHGQKP